MSWKLFKVNMLLFMNNPLAVGVPPAYGVKLATEYDSCMRRGGQLLFKNPVQVGSIPLFVTMMNVAHLNAISATQPAKHAFLKDVGNAVKGYWTGATLLPFPTPMIPAPGAISNILANSALVTNTGTWPKAPFEIPTASCLSFLDVMVLFMQIHLLSIQGMYMTTSMYPSAPAPIPGPGVLQWVGYNIPNIPFPALKLTGNGGDNNGGDNNGGSGGGNNNIAGKPASEYGSDGNFGSLDENAFTGRNVPLNAGQAGEESEQIDNELRAKLSNGGGTLNSNLDDILRAETQKDLLGRKRFFTDADLMVADMIDSQENKIIRKSLEQIRRELEDERKKCCDDCD